MTRKSNRTTYQRLTSEFDNKLYLSRYKRRLLMHETPIPMFQDVLNKLLAEKNAAKQLTK